MWTPKSINTHSGPERESPPEENLLLVLELKEPPLGSRGEPLHLVLEESLVLIVLELRESRPVLEENILLDLEKKL